MSGGEINFRAMVKKLNGQLVNPVYLIITGVLAILIVYIVPWYLEEKMAGKTSTLVLSREALTSSSSKKVEEEAPEVSLPITIKRDPFLPSYMRVEDKASGVFSSEELGFSLSGIVWDPRNPVAIINGEMKHVGEVVNGKTILEIKEDRVLLGEGKARYTVTLWGQKE